MAMSSMNQSKWNKLAAASGVQLKLFRTRTPPTASAASTSAGAAGAANTVRADPPAFIWDQGKEERSHAGEYMAYLKGQITLPETLSKLLQH
jgi:hypothetical protein